MIVRGLAIVTSIILLSLFTAERSHAATFLPFGSSDESAPPVLEVERQDHQGVSLILRSPGAYLDELEVAGQTFHTVTMPDQGMIIDPGKPALPTYTHFLAVPKGASVEVTVQTENLEYGDYLVYPSQPPAADGVGLPTPPFAFDPASYSSRNLYPSAPVLADGRTTLRGLDLLLLRFFPVQYLGAERTLVTHPTIRVRVTFKGSQGHFFHTRTYSPWFDGLYRNLVVNRDSLERVKYDWRRSGGEGADYLIVTDDRFLPAAKRLAKAKRLLGLSTRIVTMDQLGRSAEQLVAYIKNAYSTWQPAPSFLLLLGDSEFVPTNYRTKHPYNPGLTGTDLYYAAIDGEDLYADISHGRISVDTLEQAEHSVNKILAYEFDPIDDQSYYTRAANAAYFQHAGNGYAERRFVLTSEETRTHLQKKGLAVDRIYVTEPDVNPLYWNKGTYANGEPIPDELRRPNFAWDGDREDIIAAIEQGRLVLNHRDHGATWGWGDPKFTVADVLSINNGKKTPVVFSINCQTGWFDNETDKNNSTPFEEVHFSEAWERNPQGGAVGVVAATRVSYSGWNDMIFKGFYDAVYPDFVPGYGGSTPEYRLGHIVTYGKVAGENIWAKWPEYKTVEFEMFHWFGDPSMQLRTRYPRKLGLTHPAEIPFGSTEVTIETDLPGTHVALLQHDEMIGAGHLEQGRATISLFRPLTDNTLITVVGSAHDAFPYRSVIRPSATGAAFVSATSVRYDDTAHGDGDGIPEAGEKVSLAMTVNNFGKAAVQAVSARLTLGDRYLNLELPMLGIGDLNPGDARPVNGFLLAIAPETPDGYEATLRLTFSAEDGLSWNQELSIVVQAAPALELDQTSVELTLQAGSIGKATLVVRNSGLGILDLGLSHQLLRDRDAGGPDDAGYTFRDSNDPKGPAFVWEDISSFGTAIATWHPVSNRPGTDDGYSDPLALPFPFPYYSAVHTAVHAVSNGLLTFAPISDSTNYGFKIPYAYKNLSELIAPLWQNLTIGSDSAVYYHGNAERFIVQYQDVWIGSADKYRATFQVVLYPSGHIDFRYQRTDSITLMVAGIQDKQAITGLLVYYRPKANLAGVAARIRRKVEWLGYSPKTAKLPTGQEMELLLAFDARDLEPGDHAAQLVLRSNDPDHGKIILPILLHVIE
ncbi:MAG: hypothetical protein A2284_19345 [Deltaproteobacteria bacterium RIFOXYA12_FULL_61_11]|nr:MAG: hypothetical protein A2284_19345 [Deltaproteobacteria bacterium RIFOXYA12_FULL_61_11]